MVNHIVRECNNIEQNKCKTKYDPMGKVIHMELFNWLNFEEIIKCYMHKLEWGA